MVRAQLNISIINKETKPLDLGTPTVWKQTKDADTMVLGLLSPNMAHLRSWLFPINLQDVEEF